MMQTFIDAMVVNLENVGIGLAIFVIAYLANMCFGLFYNIKMLGENFDKSRIGNGILKAIVFVIGMALITIGVTGLPVFAEVAGFTIPDEYVEVFSVAVIVGMPLYGAVKYIKQAHDKMQNIFNNNVPKSNVTVDEDNTVEDNSKESAS